MFGLSKKQEEPQYSDVITKVHNEFETAGEKLYQEALGIINSPHAINFDKIKKLREIGFVLSREVVDAQTKINLKNMSLEMAKIIEHYRMRYPLNKFITEEQVKEICQKYGLVYGAISLYTGFVPMNKVAPIASFKLRKEDRVIEIGSKSTYGLDEGTIRWDNGDSADRYSNIFRKVKKVKEMCIAAPQLDFDMTNREIRNFGVSVRPIPDPVVLAPVKYGFLIVTAWGDEASDPLVVNEISN